MRTPYIILLFFSLLALTLAAGSSPAVAGSAGSRSSPNKQNHETHEGPHRSQGPVTHESQPQETKPDPEEERGDVPDTPQRNRPETSGSKGSDAGGSHDPADRHDKPDDDKHHSTNTPSGRRTSPTGAVARSTKTGTATRDATKTTILPPSNPAPITKSTPTSDPSPVVSSEQSPKRVANGAVVTKNPAVYSLLGLLVALGMGVFVF
ncbi:MAG: hypothetical protein Q9182_007402 [Xanthomendoza sp. 2 TL-2023]